MRKAIVYLLAGLVLLVSCEGADHGQNHKVNYLGDLDYLRQQSKNTAYSIDSISVDIYKGNTYRLFFSVQNLSIDTLAEDEFIFIPLLATTKPVKFLGLPKIETGHANFSPELAEINTKSGGYYYLLSLENDDIFKIKKDSARHASFTINYIVNEPKATNDLRLPLNTPTRQTSLVIRTDIDQDLDSKKISTQVNKDAGLALNEQAAEEGSTRRTYTMKKGFSANEVVGLDVSLMAPGEALKKWVRIIAFVCWCILLLMIIRDYKKNQSKRDAIYVSTRTGLVRMITRSLKHSRSSLILKIILLLYLFILIFVCSSAAQPNPRTTIADDIKLTIKPNFDDDGHLSATAVMNMLLVTTDEKKANQEYEMIFYSRRRENEIGAVSIEPADMSTIRSEPIYQRDYKINISSVKKLGIPIWKFKTLYNGDTVINYADEVNEETANKKRGYITAIIPFTVYEYTDVSRVNEYIHKFPYDERKIIMSIKPGLTTRIRELSSNHVSKFVKRGPYIDTVAVPVKGHEFIPEMKVKNIREGRTAFIRLDYSRSWVLKWLVPVIFLIAAIILGVFAGIASEKKLGKLAGAIVSLAGVYKLVMVIFAPGIPDAMDFEGEFCIADFILGGAIILLLIVYLFARKLPNKQGGL